MYAPQMGRFLSRDPAGYVDGVSLYEALQSNPTDKLDPSGRATWKNERLLSPSEIARLKIYVCVVQKAMANTFTGDATYYKQLLTLIQGGVLPGGVDVADPTASNHAPYGETSWEVITLSSSIINDPILGPENLFHEYTHWQASIVANWWYNILEFAGADSWSDPANNGLAVQQQLSALDAKVRTLTCCDGSHIRVSALDDLYCDCGDTKSCKSCP